MKIKKCPKCGTYTLREKCRCKIRTKLAGYKFIERK